jgi:Leucine-rich repeat (LRR) protein/energy-coupling factor transporter ATP-binding protein EcfA2
MIDGSLSLFTQPIQAPYPGLRSFQPHESAIFFGRNEHVADMLTVLENHRFLAVVGPSGGGKSSLVLAGLIPALHRGELITAQSDDWRFLILRPGDTPYLNLAKTAQQRLWPADGLRRFHDGDAGLTELVLRGSPFGFIETLRDAAIPEQTNVLLMVDQFEELFRFRTQEFDPDGTVATRRNTAAAFVQLLLETAKQTRRPVYVMLTMRTDFLGDCDVFDGLPQAINQSQYLTPRLSLTQLAEAIVRPLQQAPFHGSVASEIAQRILNDLGTGRDELPIVQHVLFRAWQRKKQVNPNDVVRLTLSDYDTVGGLKNALSLHADEALNEFKMRGQERIVQKVFCGLCTRGANGQHIRRPATIQQLADESGFSTDDVISVVEAFRRDDRCFLMPPNDRELTPSRKVDISHESILRQWTNLNSWVEQESRSAAMFIRLRDAALRWPEQEPLLRDPALSVALNWKELQQPSPAWAERYGGELSRTLEYLRKSQEERQRELRAAEIIRRQELEDAQARAAAQTADARRFRIATNALSILFIAALLAATYAFVQRQHVVSLNKNAQQLKVEKQSLQDDKTNLIDAIAKLGIEKRKIEVKVQTLLTNEANLIVQQNQLQQFNEALAAIGSAYGSVQASGAGEVAIVFHEGDVSPDAVLPLLGRVGKVQSLNLSRTSVSVMGLKAITGLPSLKSLDLSFTETTDEGLSQIAAMRHLTTLFLNDTALTADGMSQLETLIDLKTLDVSHDQVNQASVDRLGTKLSGCSIIYNPDPLLDAISKYHGDLDRALLSVGGGCTGNTLSFFDSLITDAALRVLAKWGRANTLSLLYCNRITNDGLKYLRRIPNLNSVEMGMCSQITDLGIENMNLGGISDLKSLKFDSIALTDRGLKAISQSTALTNLTVTGNGQVITDEGMAYLARLAHLETLQIGPNSNLGAKSLVHIAKLRNLRVLSFWGNDGVPGSSLVVLTNLTNLRELDLKFTKQLTDADLTHLEKLTYLKTLNLANCVKLTKEGVAKLRRTLVGTEVTWEKATIEELLPFIGAPPAI